MKKMYVRFSAMLLQKRSGSGQRQCRPHIPLRRDARRSRSL
jgi:hypothetical protein